MSMYPKFLSI